MSVLESQPQTLNLASELNFQFILQRAPSVSYFCQEFTIPDVGLPSARVPTPSRLIPFVGDHMVFENLSLTFKIDEDLQNYLEIFNWMHAIGNPNNTGTQYTQLEKNKDYSGYGIYSDIQVFTLDTQKQTKYVVTFKHCSPISLTGPKYTTKNPSVNYMPSTVNFTYTDFTFNLP